MPIKHVALFGASFNPPTGAAGHVGIVTYLASRFDQVWLLPVYSHPFDVKRVNNDVTYEQKIDMLRAAFNLMSSVYICQTEKELFEINNGTLFGTLDVLEYLKATNTGIDFTLIMGEDTIKDLSNKKWMRSAELMNSVSILGIRRHGISPLVDCSMFSHLEWINVPSLCEVSSSNVRAQLKNGRSVDGLVSPSVLAYIRENKLYSGIPIQSNN
jgi:nicotinate-nucleotide adenylyltransferase